MSKSPVPRPPQTAEQIRRNRNRMLGLSLAGFVILVFFISMAKMS